MNTPSSRVAEIFSSLQGEGPYVGTKQIFIRLAECNLACSYCDESASKAGVRSASYAAAALVKAIKRLDADKGPHWAISLTGGEPLLQADALEGVLVRLKEEGYRIYLETNGTLSESLKRIIRWVDIISMDMKLPSALRGKEYLRDHQSFLKIAKAREVFVKVVFYDAASLPEIMECARCIAKVDPKIPLILQPAHGSAAVVSRRIQDASRVIYPKLVRVLHDVRIIGQMHKAWRIR